VQVLLRDYLRYREEASLLQTNETLESIKKLPTTLR